MDAYDRINQTLIFKELAKALEERGGRLSFSSLLVTPIQRIPRYLLLLRVRTSTSTSTIDSPPSVSSFLGLHVAFSAGPPEQHAAHPP